MTANSAARVTRSDIPAYAHYLITSCNVRTLGAWRRAGRPNPFIRQDARADMVTRTQIVNLFFT